MAATKIYNGSSWSEVYPKIFNGSTWVSAIPKLYLDYQTTTNGFLDASYYGYDEYYNPYTVTVEYYGYSTAQSFGSISDGTSNIYSGASITELYYLYNAGYESVTLNITGASNANWNYLCLGTSIQLIRSAATYYSGQWNWTVSGNPFSGGTTQAVFYV